MQGEGWTGGIGYKHTSDLYLEEPSERLLAGNAVIHGCNHEY